MNKLEFLEQYIITKDRRAAFCRCALCNHGCHYDIETAFDAVNNDAPMQCPNCQAYEVMPMRREEK